MSVVLLSGDLVVASRVEGAAARVGVSAHSFSAGDILLAHCRQHGASLVLVDLSTPSLDVAGLVGELATLAPHRPAVVAFGPHVHEALLAGAQRAGCDEVISRGQFFAQLEEMLGRVASGAPPHHDDSENG